MIEGAWLEVSCYWLLGPHSPKEKASVEHDSVETTLVKLIYTHSEILFSPGIDARISLERGFITAVNYFSEKSGG